jgi:hypothetical protein
MDKMPKFHTNLDMHTVNTEHKHDLHVPNANLNRYEKVVNYTGIHFFNN